MHALTAITAARCHSESAWSNAAATAELVAGSLSVPPQELRSTTNTDIPASVLTFVPRSATLLELILTNSTLQVGPFVETTSESTLRTICYSPWAQRIDHSDRP